MSAREKIREGLIYFPARKSFDGDAEMSPSKLSKGANGARVFSTGFSSAIDRRGKKNLLISHEETKRFHEKICYLKKLYLEERIKFIFRIGY